MQQTKYASAIGIRPGGYVNSNRGRRRSGSYITDSPDRIGSDGGDWLDRLMDRCGKSMVALIRGGVGLIVIVLIIFAFIIFISAQPIHGNTLAEFCQNIRSERVEYAVFCTMDGKAFLELTDHTSDTVHISAGFLTYVKAFSSGEFIFAHNHPSDLAHSTPDIISCTQMQPTKAVIAARNHIYCLEAPNGWPSTQAVKSYLSTVTKWREKIGAEVTYCSTGDYIELCNYPDVMEDFLTEFQLVMTVEDISSK